MQAIVTRYLGPTNTRPSRIVAQCERGKLVASYDSLPCGDMSGEGAHISAARLLCERFAQEDASLYASPIATSPWLRPLVTGGLPDGSYAHVFLPR